MNNISGWFRQIGYRINSAMQRYMVGRYGRHDRLNIALLVVGLILCIIAMFTQVWWIDAILTLGSYVLLIFVLLRFLSRNTYKRYQENRRFLVFLDQLQDRNNRYFNCPKCSQTVRVPRGKGKIAITCPKCRERFVKKT